MTMVSFSDSDLLRNKIVEPAWYLLDIHAHRTWSPTKDGQSNNCHIECTIMKNADNGADDFVGVPIEFSSTISLRLRDSLKDSCVALVWTSSANARYTLESAVGKKIEAFIENDTYNGRLINRCNHKYRMLRESAQ